MAEPTASEQYLNELLTEVAIGYVQADTKYAARRVFATVPVQKQSSRYATFDRGDWLRDELQYRADATESAGSGYAVSTEPYNCEVWALHKDVGPQARANASDPFRPDEQAARFLAQKALIKLDTSFAASFFSTGVWATTLTGGSDFLGWDNANSTPVENISDQMAEVEADTGFLPNVLTVNRRGWMALRNHPDVVDRVKGAATNGAPATVTQQAVAAVLELDEVVVAAAVKNSAAKGATASVDYIFGNHALLSYRTSAPSVEEPSAGYTFSWEGLPGAGVDGLAVSTMPVPLAKATRHEIEVAYDMKCTAATLGVFFSGVAS